jgi:hypothetical protein
MLHGILGGKNQEGFGQFNVRLLLSPAFALASNSALWVLGVVVVDFIGQMTLAKMGPGLNSKACRG